MRRALLGTALALALALAAGPYAGAARAPSLFPLADGNRWTFTDLRSGTPRVISVRRQAGALVLRGFPGTAALRVRRAGQGGAGVGRRAAPLGAVPPARGAARDAVHSRPRRGRALAQGGRHRGVEAGGRPGLLGPDLAALYAPRLPLPAPDRRRRARGARVRAGCRAGLVRRDDDRGAARQRPSGHRIRP